MIFFSSPKSVTDAWTFLQMKREEEEERGRERERERKKKREEKRSARDGGESNANEIKGWRGKRKKERKKEKSQVLENEKTNFSSSSSSSSFFFLFFPSCFFLSFLVFWIFFFLQKLAICSTALLSRLSIGFEPPLPPFKVRERETKKKKGATFLFCLLLFFLASRALWLNPA